MVEMEKDAIKLADVVEGASYERRAADRGSQESAGRESAAGITRPRTAPADPSWSPAQVPGEPATAPRGGPGNQPGLPDRRRLDDGGLLHALQLPGRRGTHPRASAAGPRCADRQAADGAAGGVRHAAGRVPGQWPRAHQCESRHAACRTAESDRRGSHHAGDAARRRSDHAPVRHHRHGRPGSSGLRGNQHRHGAPGCRAPAAAQ